MWGNCCWSVIINSLLLSLLLSYEAFNRESLIIYVLLIKTDEKNHPLCFLSVCMWMVWGMQRFYLPFCLTPDLHKYWLEGRSAHRICPADLMVCCRLDPSWFVNITRPRLANQENWDMTLEAGLMFCLKGWFLGLREQCSITDLMFKIIISSC